jgi:hypothetical protein
MSEMMIEPARAYASSAYTESLAEILCAIARATGWNPVPSDLVKAYSYIRKNSQSQDVVQDSENDPRLWVTGLAERQDLAADSKSWLPVRLSGFRQRLDELATFKNMTNETDVIEFTRRHKISWYILRHESKVAWPASVLGKPVFRAGNYRVYHFTP